MPVVTLGVHIVDVLTRPVEFIPPGQDTVLVEQIRDPNFLTMLAAARARGTLVTMDLLSTMADLVTSAGIFLPYVDYFLPNEEQAQLMSGESDPEKAALALLAQGPRGVLVTLGAEGSLVATADGVTGLPALDVEVVDTTGCGDAYCAGFIAGLVGGKDALTSARWGTAAAATVAQGLGSDACLVDLPTTLALLS